MLGKKKLLIYLLSIFSSKLLGPQWAAGLTNFKDPQISDTHYCSLHRAFLAFQRPKEQFQ